MTSPYDTANEFRQLMRDAECHKLTVDEMANRLEISEDYAKQLWHGKHKISAPIRAKLDALIAAKAKEPVGDEQSADKSREPRFHVTANDEGGWNVVEREWVLHHTIIARVVSYAGEEKATRIAELLNKEGD